LLSHELQTRVEVWESSPKITRETSIAPEELPNAWIPIGLALKALGRVSGGFNFRKGAFAYRQSFEILKVPLAIALTLIFLLSLLAGFYLHQSRQRQKAVYEKLVSQAEKADARVNPDAPLFAMKYWDRISAVQRRFQERLAESQDPIPQIPDAVRRWPSLWQELGEVRKHHYFTVEYFVIGCEEIVLEGRTQDDFVFDLLKSHLRKLCWVDTHEDSLRVIYSQRMAEPKNPSLLRHYKFWIKLRNES
jgi:hypothetical protein